MKRVKKRVERGVRYPAWKRIWRIREEVYEHVKDQEQTRVGLLIRKVQNQILAQLEKPK